MPLGSFHPIVADWFRSRFAEPTEPQVLGWPHIQAGEHTLIAAPTGSGKTMAAFMVCLDRLLRRGLANELVDAVDVVYVSPLKALSNDVQRNLLGPLAEIEALAQARGFALPAIRAAVRTGDTPPSERQAMVKRPPHILVTTPESLYLLLTSSKSRDMLRSVQTVIVDEIHALARDKRGSHLTLSLERLAALCPQPPTRIGLSATQKPMSEIAQFLVGSGNVDAAGEPRCAVVDVGHLRQLDLGIDVPASELEAVCSHEQWNEIYERLVRHVQAHRSTLIFVNTRRLAERVTHKLAGLLGEDAVASHHGSLSRQHRLDAEQRLKEGKLKAIVATASLEMGIDVGFLDLVCQVGSPRSIATFLQRVGRSGHSLGVVPKGRLFPLTRDELVESIALLRAASKGRLDRIEIPEQPLDILAQQIVAIAASDEWAEDDLFALCRRAWPYRNLARADFDELVRLLHEGMAPALKQGQYLFRDAVHRRIKARPNARLAALMNGGAIPELADFRVVTEGERTLVGTLNEDFALESMAGDVFLLGNMSWRVCAIRGGEVIVNDAQGAPATIPFWLGEAPGRTDELSTELSRLRQELDVRIPALPAADEAPATLPFPSATREPTPAAPGDEPAANAAIDWLMAECPTERWALEQVVKFCAAQKAAVGFLPTRWKILFERFFDESGGMQVVVHAPLGARVTRAWGLAIRKRFCRSFDFELQASADDDGFVLAIGPQHSFPLDALFKMLDATNAEPLLKQALLAAPMFEARWRWNAGRSLAVQRMRQGKKVPAHLLRFRADDLLAAVFPAKTGCFENHHGDIDIPEHPLVRQTIHDCLTEAMDLPRWLQTLDDFKEGKIEFVALDTREPSPFCLELVNASPYAFLDDAPLEERRARAVSARRGLSIEATKDLGRFDPEAIAQVRAEAWPLVRDADELHDTLLSMAALPASEGLPWRQWFEPLRAAGRATLATTAAGDAFWVAAERWPMVRALYSIERCEPTLRLPAELDQPQDEIAACLALLRGRLPCVGPVSVERLAADLKLPAERIAASLEALEGEGSVLRGAFTDEGRAAALAGMRHPEWCDRRLLARIHRSTLDGLRRQIQPVDVGGYFRFLVGHHRALPELRLRGLAGVREVVDQLQGLELPAGAWEARVLAARVGEYDPAWLDQLSLSGEVVWGRLGPPQRDEEGPSFASLNRAIPIALAGRGDLTWLLPPRRPADVGRLRGNALVVFELLQARGALFYPDLLAWTALLPAHLDAALYELAAQGFASSDAFGAVRALTAERKKGAAKRRKDRGPARRAVAPTMAGRWSLFPGALPDVAPEARIQRWAWQLLKRWGVVFRDLLAREPNAPPWHQLCAEYRRLEARGEIRGGRFVAAVGGEQFAASDAVDRLRAARDQAPGDDWLILSAADPLNLTGVVLPGPRLPALTSNSFAVAGGRVVGIQQAGQVELTGAVEAAKLDELTRQLKRIG